MRILIVGADTPGALEHYCAAALEGMSHAVRFFDIHAEFIQHCRFYQTPVLNVVEHALRRIPFNRRLVQAAQRWQPEMVLVFKGVEMFISILDRLLALPNRPILANWNPDNPFDFPTYNTNQRLIASIPKYDVYFTWGQELLPQLRAAGARRVEYLPFGYDPDAHHPTPLAAEERERLHSQIGFVGGYTPERAALLEALADFDVRIWGTGWERLAKGRALRGRVMGGWTHGTAMAKVFLSADIVMNFIRPQNGQAHNMRTFEVPAVGAFMLATRTREQLGWLPEDEAAAYFADAEEMRSKVGYYLDHPGERARIAAEGHKRITTGTHTYVHRMRKLMGVVEGL
jgi:spore maturation protein CgeB